VQVTNKTDHFTEWLDNVTAQQDAAPKHDDPVFSVEDVYRRFPAIEEVQSVIHLCIIYM